jgi:hypothetical protein
VPAWLHPASHEAKTAPKRTNGRAFIFDALHETVSWPPVRRSLPKHIRAKSLVALGLKCVFVKNVESVGACVMKSVAEFKAAPARSMNPLPGPKELHDRSFRFPDNRQMAAAAS